MKFIYAVPIFASIIITGITGCSDKPNNDTKINAESSATTAEDSVPETKVKEKPYVSPLGDDVPTYKVDVMPYAPFHMRSETGESIGYDIDLIHAIGEEAGFKTTISEVPFSNIFIGVKEGTKDLAMSGLSMLPERMDVMLASKPYLKGTTGYLVKEGTIHDTKEKIADQRIAVLEDSSLSQAMVAQGSTNLILKPSMFGSIQAVFTNEADAVFGFEASLLYESEQFSHVPSKFIANSDPIMIVAWSNPSKTDVIDNFNKGLDKVMANGRFQKINEKWFGDNADHMMIKQ